ncbi:MAG: NAD(P)/FAD-dependent oxidoreductase [Cryomorphaceae bacterium]|nr:FAD-binding oxidoreductase [Flavobacteriales bacterium]
MEKIIILGQGIAGSIIAFRLLEAGIPPEIVDDNHKHSSSMVAAGLWNPIVFRRINKSWKADEFIPELESFFTRVEWKLGADFYQSLDISRMHSSKLEQDLWMEKKTLPGFFDYLGEPEDVPPTHFESGEFGLGKVHRAGYIDLPAFLQSAAEFFKSEGLYKQANISDTWIAEQLAQNDVAVIDCRGYQSAFSGYWSYLPFGLTKGEVLTISCDGLDLESIFNAGFFVCPLGENRYRVGATFNWDDCDQKPTEDGKQQLVEKLEKWLKSPFEIEDHKAGVRPTVQDRRPLIGVHPNHKNLWLFNGMGTKGVMLAPQLSQVFTSAFLHGNPIPKEMNISRFEKLLGQQNPTVNYPNP